MMGVRRRVERAARIVVCKALRRGFRVALRAQRVSLRLDARLVRHVAVEAGDACFCHLALLEGAVFEHLVENLPIGEVKILRSNAGEKWSRKAPPGPIAIDKPGASRMAGEAGVRLTCASPRPGYGSPLKHPEFGSRPIRHALHRRHDRTGSRCWSRHRTICIRSSPAESWSEDRWNGSRCRCGSSGRTGPSNGTSSPVLPDCLRRARTIPACCVSQAMSRACNLPPPRSTRYCCSGS